MAWVFFFLFGAIGALSPFLAPYFQSIGMSATETSTLLAVTPLMLFLSQPIFGPLTDRSGHRGRMLGHLLVVVAVSAILVAVGRSFWLLIPLVALWAFFAGVVVPIADSIALGEVVRTGVSYPRLRLWGSIGFLLVTKAAGSLYDRVHLGWSFVLYAGFMLVAWYFARRLPAEGVSARTAIGPALRSLLRKRELLAFLILSSVMWLSQAAHSTFFSIHMRAIGGSMETVGTAWSLAALMEVPVWLVLGRITRRTGPWPILTVAAFMFGLRWWLYASVTSPDLLVWLQVLQGVTFALFYPTAVVLVGELAGEELRTSGQALLVLVTGGISTVVGTLAAGRIVDTWNTAMLYRVGAYVAWLAGAGFVALMIARRFRSRTRTEPAPEGVID